MENIITIYGFEHYTCPFCKNAKRLCETKKLDYTYIPVDRGIGEDGKAIKDTTLINEVIAKAGKEITTMPQIFINDVHIGGFEEFRAYVIKNKLHG